jgi:hypothetical protein
MMIADVTVAVQRSLGEFSPSAESFTSEKRFLNGLEREIFII